MPNPAWPGERRCTRVDDPVRYREAPMLAVTTTAVAAATDAASPRPRVGGPPTGEAAGEDALR